MPLNGVNETESKEIPRAALYFAACAYSPIMVGSGLIAFASPTTAAITSVIQLSYGSAFLALMGGVPWGAAMTNYARAGVTPTETQNISMYSLGLLPPMVAWSCMLQPTKFGLLALAAGYVMTLLIDSYCQRLGRLPAWWTRLTIPLALLVALGLLISFLSVPDVKVVELIAFGKAVTTASPGVAKWPFCTCCKYSLSWPLFLYVPGYPCCRLEKSLYERSTSPHLPTIESAWPVLEHLQFPLVV
jgi:hypothetical protein